MKEEQVLKSPDSCRGLGIRHVQILLQVLFYVIITGVQASISVILPALLSSEKKFQDIPFSKISEMLTSDLLGFLLAELFSSVICKRYGVKWPMVILMGVISAATLNLPMLTTDYGLTGLVTCRVIQGVCTGLLFALPADVISRWAPVKERTVLGTAVYAGPLLGSSLTLYAGGILANTNLDWSVLETQLGYLTIIWVVLMAIFGADSPEESNHISESELDYVVHNRGNVTIKKKIRIPWRQILTSMPFWAIVVGQIGAGWILFVLITNIPMLLIIRFNMEPNNFGNLVALVSLITWLLSFSIAAIAQMLINGGRTTIEQSRKLLNTLGTCIPALMFILLTIFTTGNQYVGIAIMVIISVSNVGTICGSRLNSNDITTNFAPVVYGIATWFSFVFNMISITLLAMHGWDDWTFVLLYSAILAILTNLFYVKFASGEEQDWNLYEDLEENEMDLSKSASRASVDEGKYLLYVRKQ